MRLVVLTPLLAIAACAPVEEPEAFGCTASIEPGVIVEIHDAVTGKAIADVARGIVVDGTFTDSLSPAESTSSSIEDLFSRQSAWERPGRYSVHVERAGYHSWDTTGIIVSSGACHVRTVRLFSRLVPNS